MSTIIWIVILIVALAAGIGAGYFIGYNNRKKTAEAQIGSAEAEATRLVNEAIKTADQKRKEAILEAKDEAFRLKAEVDAQKAEADKEIKQRRAEISRQENRIDQKETALDRKTEALEKREEELKKKHEEAEAHLAEVDALRAKEMERLETLAGLSQEDAREVLLHKVDEELTHEKAIRVAAYETDLKENCDGIARNLIGLVAAQLAEVVSALKGQLRAGGRMYHGGLCRRAGQDGQVIEGLRRPSAPGRQADRTAQHLHQVAAQQVDISRSMVAPLQK